MVNNTCLCSPEEYPISLTMAVVRNRTELKGRGAFTLLPDTSVIAIASPIARPTPRTIAVTIPDLAAGRMDRKMVCTWEAPSAREDDLIPAGTARMEVSLILITVGRIMIASTITADNRFAPPVNWCVVDPRKISLSNLYMRGFNK